MSLTREQIAERLNVPVYHEERRLVAVVSRMLAEARAEVLEEAIRVASVAGSLGDDATQSAIVKSLRLLGDAPREQEKQ